MILSTIALIFFSTIAYSDDSELHLVQIQADSSSQGPILEFLGKMGIDLSELGATALGPTAVLRVDELEQLIEVFGAEHFSVLNPLSDSEEENEGGIAMGLGGGPPLGFGSMAGFYTYDEIGQKLDELHDLFPGLVSQKISIGLSYEGREIWAIRVSNNPEVDQNKPRVFLDAMHHAREPMSMMSLFHVVHHLASSYGVDPALTQLVDNRELWVVPIVNPDGYVYNQQTNPAGGGLWRKNRRPPPTGSTCWGVDLNRNYSIGWGGEGSSASPCSETYRGTSAFSEPETIVLSNFYLAKGPFGASNTVHTSGSLYMYPWGHSSEPCPDEEQFELLAPWQTEINHYIYGPGYSTIYPVGGGSRDWNYAVLDSMAFTTEIGVTFWPSSTLIESLGMENLDMYTRLLASAGAYLRPLSHSFSEIQGNQNGRFDFKETIGLSIELQNIGNASSSKIEVELHSLTPHLTVLTPDAAFAALAPFTTQISPANALRLRVNTSAVPGSELPVAVTISHDGFTSTQTLLVPVGTPEILFSDNSETPLWTVGAPGDTAPLNSLWARADPTAYTVTRTTGNYGSIVYEAQPADDVSTTGALAWVTGGPITAVSGNLNGQTSLTSPILDLSTAWNPRLRFSRYFSSYKPNSSFLQFVSLEDTLQLLVSNDGGGSWNPLRTFTSDLNAKWRNESLSLPEEGVPLASNLQFRLVARDQSPPSTTEALVDEFIVESFPPQLNQFTDNIDLTLAAGTASISVHTREVFSISFAVGNQGPDPASNVALQLVPPAGLSRWPGTGTPAMLSTANRIRISIGNLGPGETETRSLTLVAAREGSFVLNAKLVFQEQLGVFGKAIELNPSNNLIRIKILAE